jgi:hypothetical protein
MHLVQPMLELKKEEVFSKERKVMVFWGMLAAGIHWKVERR